MFEVTDFVFIGDLFEYEIVFCIDVLIVYICELV